MTKPEAIALICRFIGQFGDKIRLEPIRAEELRELSTHEPAADHQPIGAEMHRKVPKLR
jgi:hypothetical protein